MADASSTSNDNLNDLELRFGGRLVEQLGAQMYPSATATVAELISNAWDADARHVWVQMPFGDWENGEIVVTDDGLGMTHDEAKDAYLIVGRNRRENGSQRSPGGRLVHGRKGIGKLAAFGTATILELKTLKQGYNSVAFRLDYEHIRHMDPDVPYTVEPSEDLGALANPSTGEPLAHGTRIRLTGLRLKRRLNKEQFVRSMARRFALSDQDMLVLINDEPLRRFELDLEIRFPPDAEPPEAKVDGRWAVERLSNGEEVRWWIGFTRTPLRGEADQGISVLVRGKLAQRPFKFERNSGTTGQLGQEYLVGEVVADWIDDEETDADEDRDYIQSNRDQLQIEDSFLDPLLEWGQRRLTWALRVRNDLRADRHMDRIAQIEPLERILDVYSERERNGLLRVADAISRLPEVDDSQLVKVMEAVVDTREGETARALADQIAVEGFDPQRFWPLLYQLSELDDRNARAFVYARLETLAQLQGLVADENLPDTVQRLLAVNPGLLDPNWEGSEYEEIALDGAETPDRSFLLVQPNRAKPLAAVLVVSDSDSVPLEPRLAELDRRAPGTPVVAIVRTDNVDARGLPDAWITTLEALLGNSESLHQGWLEVIERRSARPRAGESS